MDCQRYEAILSGETGPALARALEAHWSGCPSCAGRSPDERALLLAMATSVEATLRVEPSADFLARVRQRVADERARPSRPARSWWVGVAATAAFLVVLFAARARWGSRVEEARPPVAEAPARAAAGPRGPETAVPVPAPSPEGPRRRRGAFAPAGPPQPRPAFGADVIVEPGQAEALARLASGFARSRPRSTFLVASLDPEAPLPRLAPLEPPRFEMKRLDVPPVDWGPAGGEEDPAGDGEADPALEPTKGSDS